MSKKSLEILERFTIVVGLIGIALMFGGIYPWAGGLLLFSAAVTGFIESHYRQSQPFAPDEIKEWEKVRAGGMKNYIWNVVQSVLLGVGALLALCVIYYRYNGQSLSEVFQPGLIIIIVGAVLLVPYRAYGSWRSNEEKYNKSQAFADEN